MGVSYSTARWLAPASFLYDFAMQQYGMFSTPNMKTIHDQHLSFFSPQPFFIAGFFFPQQLFQLAWLYRLWKLDPKKSQKEKRELDQIVEFVPYYALGNVCIGTWMIFWNSSQLKIANVFVVVNTLTQLLFMTTRLPQMNLNSTSSVLTHIVSKTFAGIGVLDILHNTSVAYFDGQTVPSTLIKVLTGVGFVGASFMSDWIFGGCLVYDLIALAIGRKGTWGGYLWGYAGLSAAAVAMKNLAMPPYKRVDDDDELAYGELPTDEPTY